MLEILCLVLHIRTCSDFWFLELGSQSVAPCMIPNRTKYRHAHTLTTITISQEPGNRSCENNNISKNSPRIRETPGPDISDAPAKACFYRPRGPIAITTT
jgi:hypothetical protein